MSIKPVKLLPAFKSYLWGGNNLKTKYNKDTDLEVVAESWELSTHPDGESLAEGTDLTLSQYLNSVGKEVLGARCERLERFPILIKFIDALNNLSVQVHPNDEYALKNEGDLGKTEVWYVLDATPDAKIYCGFNKTVTEEEVRARIEDGTLCDVLKTYNSRKGDIFFIPAGTVHAIGAGNIICEVQENSNTTYRLFDYNRRDANGNLRPLHIDKALDVATLSPAKIAAFDDNVIADCEYFKSVILNNDSSYSIRSDSFTSIIVTEGDGKLRVGNYDLNFNKGDSIFIPAGYDVVTLKGVFQVILTQI